MPSDMTTTTAPVAGGDGFFSSHLCEPFLSDRNRAVCVDNFGSGRRQNVTQLQDRD